MFDVFHFHIHVLQFTEETYPIREGIYSFVIYFTKYNTRRRVTMSLCARVCNNIFTR